MAGAALALGITGVLLSLLSLAWQIYSWTYSGPRVKVSCQHELVFSKAAGSFMESFEVVACNVGRSDVQVKSWSLLPQGWPVAPEHQGLAVNFFAQDCMAESEPLPALLKAGHSISWYLDWPFAVRAIRDEHMAGVRPIVTLASGKKVYGENFPSEKFGPRSRQEQHSKARTGRD